MLEKRLQELKIEIAEKQETSNQIEQEASKKRSFDQLLQTITKLEKKIQKINQLKIFQKDKFEVHAVYPLKPSNLFVNHKKYRKVFQIMSTYKEVGSLLEQNLTEYNSVHKSSELYEIWCYFKILEILTLEKGYQIDKISWPGKISEPFVFEDWHKTDIHKLLRKISNYIENNEKKDSIKSLEELVIHLVNGEKDIYLGYNCTFKARHTAQSRLHKVSNRLRPDIFLLLNKEIFFSCDAKYKDYRKQGMGLQAWYTDLFECAAYKYLYRLDLGNEENLCEGPLSVKERFTEADMRMNVLKNGGSCILSPAMADCDRPSKYNGYQIEEQYKTFLKYLKEGKVNRGLFGQEKLESEEYTIHLQNEISTKDYEYHVASIRFLPNDYRGFFFLFLEALKYEQAHFLEEMW